MRKAEINRNNEMKTVGKIKILKPEEKLIKAEKLIDEAKMLSPFEKPKGFIFRAKSRKEYEKWKKRQKNPWLW